MELYTRESLAIDVGQGLKGEDVVRVLIGIASQRGLPQTLKTDSGSEFISRLMDKRVYVGLKPTGLRGPDFNPPMSHRRQGTAFRKSHWLSA